MQWVKSEVKSDVRKTINWRLTFLRTIKVFSITCECAVWVNVDVKFKKLDNLENLWKFFFCNSTSVRRRLAYDGWCYWRDKLLNFRRRRRNDEWSYTSTGCIWDMRVWKWSDATTNSIRGIWIGVCLTKKHKIDDWIYTSTGWIWDIRVWKCSEIGLCDESIIIITARLFCWCKRVTKTISTFCEWHPYFVSIRQRSEARV